MPFPSVGQSNLTTAILNPYSAVSSNPIINGGFEIWQRGASFASVASLAYLADRWWYSKSGTVVHNAYQSTDVPTLATLVPGTSSCLQLDIPTTADNTSTALVFVTQTIEGYNFLPFSQKQFTVGFWVKTPVTGIYSCYVANSVPDRSCVQEFTVNLANTWEYKTVTFPASPSAGTWNYTTGIGLRVGITAACGTTYSSNRTSTLGTWQTGNIVSSTNQVNAVAAASTNSGLSTSNGFKIWGVTMGLGPTIAPYFPRPYPIELALCQRYYERQNANNANARFGWVQYVNAGGSWQGYIQILPKRLITASVTFGSSAVNNFGVDPTIGRSVNVMTQLATTCSGYTFYGINGTTTSAAASGNVAPIYCLNASDYMEFGAEL